MDKVLRVQDSLATYSEALATAAVAAAAENQRGHSIYIPPKDQPPRPGEESFCCCAMTTEDHRNVGKAARRLLLRSSRPAALPGEELRTEKTSAGPRARGQKRAGWADRPLSSVRAQRRQRVAAVGGKASRLAELWTCLGLRQQEETVRWLRTASIRGGQRAKSEATQALAFAS